MAPKFAETCGNAHLLMFTRLVVPGIRADVHQMNNFVCHLKEYWKTLADSGIPCGTVLLSSSLPVPLLPPQMEKRCDMGAESPSLERCRLVFQWGLTLNPQSVVLVQVSMLEV